MVYQVKRKLSDGSAPKRAGGHRIRARPKSGGGGGIVFTSVNFTDSGGGAQAQAQQGAQPNPICFPFGCGGGGGDRQQAEPQQQSSPWTITSAVRLAATSILYALLLGAVLRTFVYQYQISNLSAEMLDAASVRKANLERLEVVQNEMADLHTSFAELKDVNNGLRRGDSNGENRDRKRTGVLSDAEKRQKVEEREVADRFRPA